jgi:sugar lactone lactonase YvrE
MRKLLASILLASAAYAAVWVGYDGGLAVYTASGEFVDKFEDYRHPVSLQLDAENRRLWFIDAYDYKLVCMDLDRRLELFRVERAAHAPEVGSSDLRIYRLEKKPVEPSISLDAGDGGVWVADFYGHQIAKYDDAGKPLFRTGAYHEPLAIAALGDGRAWAAGGIRTLNLVGADGKSALDQAGVNEARSLSYDAEQGLVWVADYRNNRVLAVARDGKMKRRITGVELPSLVVADGGRGVVWVATHYKGIVKIDAAAEKIVATIPEPIDVSAMALAGDGGLWVTYDEEGSAVRYSAAGEKLTTINRVGTPMGIAVDD